MTDRLPQRWRVSAWPITQYCGLAGKLGSQHGAGRLAAQGTAFHALCSGEDVARAFGALTDDEANEVRSWHRPTPLTIEGLGTFRYEIASKEGEVVIDLRTGKELSQFSEATIRDMRVDGVKGHYDMCWLHPWDGQSLESGKVVIVGDFKRSHHTKPESLQLAGYGWALCQKYGARGFIPAIWSYTEGTWAVGARVDLHDDNVAQRLWQRILAAATAEARASTGPHCDGCWSRLHCPEYAAPFVEALSDFRERNLENMTNDQAVEWIAKLKAIKELADVMEANLKALSRARGGLTRDGKRWLPVLRNGRETVDTNALRAKYPELAAAFTKKGKPYEVWSWTKGEP